jgi:hypothetical protein
MAPIKLLQAIITPSVLKKTIQQKLMAPVRKGISSFTTCLIQKIYAEFVPHS